MIFRNYILENGKAAWRETEVDDTIFQLPPSDLYGTREVIIKGYDFITKESGPATSVKQQTLIAAIAAAIYAVFNDLLKEAKIQPWSLTLVGSKGTYKTTISRLVRFPSASEEDGEITQIMNAAERKKVIAQCNGGSIVLSDLRGGGNADEKIRNLLDKIVRPISDHKKGPVLCIVNGEPSFLLTKRLDDSMRDRLLIIFTETLIGQEEWVASIPEDLISGIIVTIYEGVYENYEFIKKEFLEKAHENFVNKSSKYKDARIRNKHFSLRMAHWIIITEACRKGFLTTDEALNYLKALYKAIDCLCDQMVYQQDPMEYLTDATFQSLSSQVRYVERRSFCNYSDSGSKKCSENCLYFPYDWNECPDREFRVNGCDLAVRTETEAGIAVSVSDLNQKLPYLIEDEEKVLLIVEKGRFWQEYCRQASNAKKALNVKTPHLTIQDMQQYLVTKGYLLYDPLAETKKDQYYTSWPKATLTEECWDFMKIKESGSTEVFAMYVPKRIVPNVFINKEFYLGYRDTEFKMPFEDIAKRHVNCVLS